MISLRRFTALDGEWVALVSGACLRSEMAPDVALTRNAELPVGALAADPAGDRYVVRYTLPLGGGMDPGAFDLALRGVAATAELIERRQAPVDRY